jgi:glucose/arabinose dehydrogenase
MTRNGVDIHQTNPAEELNMLGYLNGKESPNQGRNFGYPGCYTAWDVSTIPDFNGQVGQQFSIGNSRNDSKCTEAKVQAARLGFHPHMAPLDILFNDAGTEGWITFHGSWDSKPAVGYKLTVVEFANGEPVEPSTSTTAAKDILSNTNTGSCSDTDATCFRPVGLAWDKKGRLFMSSDTSGEIYMISKAGGKPINSGASASTSSGGKGSGTHTTRSTNAASTASSSIFAVLFAVLSYVL